jgi:5,10-methylenetetrahydromethanopterin reductase
MVMKAGLSIWLDRPVLEAADLAVAAEQAGFTDVWVPDHYFLRDVYVAQAVMAERTTTVRFGTAVAAALLRHPALLASSTATIDELSGGRAILGLGTGGFEFPSQLDLRATSPLAAVEDAVRIARQLFTGGAEFSGRAFTAKGAKLGWETRAIPIFLAARGPRMLELAGEVADGVITHGLAPTHIDFVRERIAVGAARAGRDPADCELCLMFGIDVDDDETAAVERQRAHCTIMAGGVYAETLIPLYGLDPDQVAPLKAAVSAGDPDAAGLVTPEMVRAFSLAGPEPLVVQGLRDLEAAGVGRVITSVPRDRSKPETLSRIAQLGRIIKEVST